MPRLTDVPQEMLLAHARELDVSESNLYRLRYVIKSQRPDVGIVWKDGDPWIVVVSDNPLDDLEAIIAANDPAQPTPDEARAQRSIEDRADWLAGQSAGERPAEVRQMVLNRLQDASTVAQMKQVLIDLLPTIAVGVVALAYQVLEE